MEFSSFEAARLAGTDRYRILRHVPELPVLQAPDGAEPLMMGAVIDTETTGITEEDELVEMAIVRFEYGSQSGRIVRVVDTFDGLQQPVRAMPEAVQRLTGLSDEILKGQTIDSSAVMVRLASANLVIAHNAAFDRRVVERTWPHTPVRPWACSMAEIDWMGEGAVGRRLSDVLALHDYFHVGHRADADAMALLHLLSLPLPSTGELTLSVLLAAARRPTAVVVAAGARFESSGALRARGYRWSPANPKAWWRSIPGDELAREIEFLDTEIYDSGREALVALIGARDRYRPLARILNQLVPASTVLSDGGA